jgi:HD-like signal output (HDOD) protein
MAFQINPQLIKQTLERATQELPPLPSVLVKVLKLTENSNSGSVGEIEQLIRSDQAISSKILRVVNSAYFGFSGQVGTVNQAVTILGFQQVRNLVLGVSMLSGFSAIGPRAKDGQEKLWERSFATASAAQLIGRRKKVETKELEIVFVGGLLQNIGALFMLSSLARTYMAVLEEADSSGGWLADVEMLRLGTNHAEVGGDLVKKWKLPEQMILLVQRHEGPFGGEAIPSLYLVNAGEKLAELVVRGTPFTMEALILNPKVSEWLAFEEADWVDLYDRVADKMDAIKALITSLRN